MLSDMKVKRGRSTSVFVLSFLTLPRLFPLPFSSVTTSTVSLYLSASYLTLLNRGDAPDRADLAFSFTFQSLLVLSSSRRSGVS